ncbi:zinc metalloprotease HtpX [candidate division CPR3 bacterium GWF2_35_18]|nr:MAG: zinc metalloprotease HtpX [candidate division CPR3 bacterium GWF2_35_18]OGB64895.1 MAG: zinc metalloprotease HtpX [candidate division CPR3 bacterium RIFOXYA2_FULL_35_13]OGB77017.1 MAG: zinc metalloprotease HtpX [candidate division CPR3 bacterium RIFOXYC2_FULL_35_7]OGB78587.1 MAG: zinc metalloprotease HtpX [candidate division CPR3 bacterium RIFOXYB2_FULL_35_8]
MVLFIMFITVISYVFGEVNGSGLSYAGVALIFSGFMSFFSYYFSDRIVLALSKAHEIQKEDNFQLFTTVENLCIGAGLPLPRIYIIDDTAPNAFATGRDPKHAVICVTTGLLQKLEKLELEGVIAHELSHIKNYDIRLMSIVVILVGLVALMSDWFLRFSFWGGGRRRRNSDEGGQLGAIFAIAAIVLALLSPLIAQLIKFAISRSREYLADASAALITRYPQGLASALEKISRDTEPLEASNKATAHLYIVNPLKNLKGPMNNLFSTHPPIEERIKKLREM